MNQWRDSSIHLSAHPGNDVLGGTPEKQEVCKEAVLSDGRASLDLHNVLAYLAP